MHSYLQENPALIQAIKRLEQLNPDQFEIYFERRTSTKIDSKDQEVDSLSKSEDVGLSVRLVKDQKLGFSFTTSLDIKAIQNAVNSAYEVATLMPEDSYVGFHSFGSSVYPAVDNFDANGLKISLSDKTDMARQLESYCRQADSRITGVRNASLSETSINTFLVDSHGEHLQHTSTGYSASITCKAESQGDSQVGSEYRFSNYLDSLDIKTVGVLSAQWAIELLGAGSAPSMKCPAILRNSVVADLLEFLADSFSAEQMDKGRSMLANKIGQPIFSDQITLVDDALLAGGMGTSPFDGEGYPSQKTILIDGGFMTGTLTNGYYSRKKGIEPTGSSVRGIKSPPSIGFSNLYLEKGRKSFESLLGAVSEGILIVDLMGLHTANPVTGNFSLGASGILIENGKLSRPVRGFAIAGNVLDLFRRMSDIGSDLKFFGRVGAPSVLISEISVGGA